MKINREDLIAALKVAKKFTSKQFDIVEKVMIDGPGQKISATNLDASVDVAIEIKDYVRKIETPAVSFSEEDLLADLESLKKTQLADLSEYAGTEPGSKASMIELIMSASKESAGKEVGPSEIQEVFCVDPGQLIKILQSDNSDEITLKVEMYRDADMFEGDKLTSMLSVGEFFQHIPFADADDFPIFGNEEFTEFYKMPLKKSDVLGVASASSADKEKGGPHTRVVFFDKEHQMMVGTDGTRLNAMDCEVPCSLKIMTDSLKLFISTMPAKEEEFAISSDENGDEVRILYGTSTVYLKNEDIKFPDYLYILQSDQCKEEVEVDHEKVNAVVSQALLVHKAGTLTFNGSISVKATNPVKGNYERFDIPYINGNVEPEVVIPLNLTYLSDYIKHSNKTNIKLRINDEKSPVILTCGNNLQAVVMPMRTVEE